MHILMAAGGALGTMARKGLLPTGCRISSFDPREDTTAQIHDRVPDAVVLEETDHGFHWLDSIRELRSTNLDCVCVLVARQLNNSAVNALFRAGGDDYLLAPISARKLIDRLSVLMVRREIQPTAVAELVLGPLRVDALQRVFVNGVPCDIPKKERMLLRFLVHHAGSLVPHEKLRALGWLNHGALGSNSLEVHISRLRRWLHHELPDHCIDITSTRSVGYTLTFRSSTGKG